MKNRNLLIATGLFFALALGGCVSVSGSPNSRFYMLKAVDASTVGTKFDITSDVIIVVGPVKIPEYQYRPQIVTQDKDGMLNFAQFDRWGETLDIGMARVIMQDLKTMLPQANFELFPCNSAIEAKYRVVMDVVQLQSRLDKDLFIAVQWLLIDAKTDKMLLIKRSEFHQPIEPENYAGLVKALSTACASLSKDIAEAVSVLAKQADR